MKLQIDKFTAGIIMAIRQKVRNEVTQTLI